MRTDTVAFVLGSEKRKKIVSTIISHPKRQWSCSFLEDITKISHATVFRTLRGLTKLGLLKSFKVNKKDVLYELAESPWISQIRSVLTLEQSVARQIAQTFTVKIRKLPVQAIILYGSTVKGSLKPYSDIDLLVIVKKHDDKLEKTIQDKAAELSAKVNKTLSVIIMNNTEVRKEGVFITSVKENMEVLYGKSPF